MTNLIVKENRVQTETKPDARIYSIYRQFEGRKQFLKNGNLSFENTQQNLSLYLSQYPDAKVYDDAETSNQIESSAPKTNRPKFELKRQQLWWQKEAHEKFKNVGPGKPNPYPVFAFLYDPGGGKSKSLTDAMCYLWCDNKIDAAIIIAPNELVCEQWPMYQLPRDIPDNVPASSWRWKKGKKADREYEVLKTFDGLQVLTMNVDAVRTKDGMARLVDFIKHHKGRVLFAFDESQFGKNQKSQRHKALSKVMGMCDWRSILTGTLIAKDLIDAWAQFKLLHEGILKHRYMSSFRSEYCETRNNGFGIEIIGHKNLDKFYKLIEPYSYRISKSELGYEKLYDEFEFRMAPDQKEAFDQLKKEFLYKLDNGEFLTVANALAGTIRMQQVTCGFLPREDGSFQYFANSRAEALEAWLDTQEGEKIMLWCRFLPEARLISKALGGVAVDLSGNVTSQERQDNKLRFINDSSVLYAVGTPDAAATGMDGLQEVCNRAAFLSHSYNSLLRRQAEDRTSRLNGETTSFYTDFICKGGVDRKQLRNLRGKEELSRMSLDDIRKIWSEDD